MLALEEALVELLRPIGAQHNAKIASLPENYYSIEGKPHSVNHIYVQFSKQLFAENVEVNYFKLVIGCKRLRGHQSVYSILESAKALLVSTPLLPFSPKPVDIESIEIDEWSANGGIWKSTIQISLKSFVKPRVLGGCVI